ncbi:seven-hairpin glycosidase [Ascobolus immersus RN42]|uniref:alpha-1,2-Mannosidase n=1 Tax=Ascobolus immersus RN42 TaxID=1160509 RepID=A0A3N4ITQ6_ASCIM|nr:seven-hairpin glycosidase [Ascobolus immersus RN42]
MSPFRGPTSYRKRFLALLLVIIIYALVFLRTDSVPAITTTTTTTRWAASKHTEKAPSLNSRPQGSEPEPATLNNLRHPRIQFPFAKYGRSAGDRVKADAIKDAMRWVFAQYKEQAWGKDEVKPKSGGGKTTRNNWGATIIDTMTTTAVMGLEEEFLQQLDFTVNNVDFTNATGLVDPFETTIRYLGSMVSTLDLIDSKTYVRDGLVSPDRRDRLLQQAVTLARMLGPTYDSPTGMPWPRVNFSAGVGCREPLGERPIPGFAHATIGPARTGTNWLENKVLSRLTGNDVYLKNATRAWSSIVWNKYVEELPGMIDGPIDIMTGAPIGNHRSWGAGHDSYYEYLIKAAIHSPADNNSEIYRDRWVQAVETTINHLATWSSPSETFPDKKRYLAQHKDGWLINEMGHLACFAAGNFLLGGRFLGKPEIIKLGLDIVDGCHHTYAMTTTRIGPEYFHWVPEGSAGSTNAEANSNLKNGIDPKPAAIPPANDGQKEQLAKWGFWITNAKWMLRPEVIESYFYAYRITGNQMYQEWAWDAFKAMNKAAKTKFGFGEIDNVSNEPGEGNINNSAESFFGAETLKYLYLIFTEDNVISLDEWVFSTEAHPFRIYE